MLMAAAPGANRAIRPIKPLDTARLARRAVQLVRSGVSSRTACGAETLVRGLDGLAAAPA
jgi:hypothetical protein